MSISILEKNDANKYRDIIAVLDDNIKVTHTLDDIKPLVIALKMMK